MSESKKENIHVSVIIPALNEAESIPSLYKHLKKVLDEVTPDKYEIIFIDDGSTDDTFKIMKELHALDKKVSIYSHRKNFGKAQAMATGFAHARGKYIFTLDADLQDDPDEIPRFIHELDQGNDLVIGWKAHRKDPFLKVISSRFFNWTNNVIFGINLHDINCGFKAYRREVIEEVEVYGELHRYVPIIAYAKGFKIAELKVKHHSRKYGRTKYNWRRYFAGFFDLLTSVVITRFAKKPLHFFGSIGSVFFFAGLIICAKLTWDWFHKIWIGDRPLLFLGVLLIIVGMQIIMIGLVSEIIINNKERKLPKLPIRTSLNHLPDEQDDDNPES
ncbi:glycosyltransferase family 2 protein [bacterium]|nr:glycosyltransferase family 2 protein [bacterium]MBU1024705.1 glycosyltransferase family 2 protein [bacterium]